MVPSLVLTPGDTTKPTLERLQVPVMLADPDCQGD